ncbi:hypothetical protein L841_4781 [Mycobacterium sp. MAC_080597_8934]|nr:hypothetical protein L841_4781 [Mycobacterium sp. MAC_080597_8934]
MTDSIAISGIAAPPMRKRRRITSPPKRGDESKFDEVNGAAISPEI